MSIEFTENTVGLLFIAFDGKDWMCGITRTDEGHQIDFRFRYYSDPVDPWDGKDKKSWYRIKTADSREMVLDKMRTMAVVLMTSGGGQAIYECVRDPEESLEQFMDRFSKLPFVHAKRVSEQEYREKYATQDEVPKP